VLDDEAPIRRLVGDLLEKLGYEAELVEDGLQAVTRYAEAFESGQRFDAVIMDLTIPGGKGGARGFQRDVGNRPRSTGDPIQWLFG